MTEKIKSKTLFQSEIETIISSEESNKELAHRYNVSKRTIQRVKAGLIDGIEDEDYQLCDESIKMKYQLQRSREANQRINKTNRETFRIADLIQTMTDEFIEVVENSKHHNFTTKIHPNKTNEIGVIQLSDLHFGERVTEVNGNEFNFEVASKRLQKLADKSTQMFKARGITSIVLACTGDLINSDRRLDEVTSNANNRAKVIYTAVEILKQLIQHLNQEFNVTVATVCGNESRINKDLGWVDFMAFDNFDAVIHMFLEFIFKDKEGITVLPMKDPLEMVIDVNGHNLCLIHGHNGLASDSACESKVTQLRAKYAAQNVRIDYVIFGHIHCHPEDVEVLTPNGYVKIKDCKIGDKVYGYENGKVVLTNVKDIVLKNYTGKMYKFNNNNLYQYVTQDHAMYLKDGEYITADEFITKNNAKGIVTKPKPLDSNIEYENVTDDELRMIVAICADGYMDEKSIRFHLKKERKIQRLTELHNLLGYDIKWSEKTKNNSFKTKEVDLNYRKRFYELLNNEKCLPNWFLQLSTRQTKVVIDELQYWDGCKISKYSYQYSSSKTKEIDIIQNMLLKCGILSKTVHKGKTIIYSDAPFGDKKVKYKEDYVKDLAVGCLTTETKNFFIRTLDDSVELSGNCSRISDLFARSSSIVGGNAYSDKALGFTSRAAQNIYIFDVDGIDGIKIDLQKYDYYKGYDFDKSNDVYMKQNDKSNIIIQKVIK